MGTAISGCVLGSRGRERKIEITTSITIVTPSFNQARFIKRTIYSVLNQSVPANEFFIFDGGSTDQTLEILKSYGDQISWVSEKDRGQAHAVNKGIKSSHGEIIGWLNSDDIYYPGALERVAGFFEENPEVDILYGDAYHIDENDRVLGKYYTEAWDFERLKNVCIICQPAAFIRKRVFDSIGFLEEDLQYCMDYDLWIRAAIAGMRFAYIPQILAGSRLYNGNKTLGQKQKVHEEINDMLLRQLGKVPDQWLFNYAHAVAERRFLREQRLSFTINVSLISLQAALRWNRSISKEMVVYIFNWIKGSISSFVKGRLE